LKKKNTRRVELQPYTGRSLHIPDLEKNKHELPYTKGYYLTITDIEIRFTEVYLMTDIREKTVLKWLRHWVAQFGASQVFIADNETQFTGRLFKAAIDEIGAKLVNTPIYHPQSNGV
jgi:transposase InsO family protein